jgi:hypothetical protein
MCETLTLKDNKVMKFDREVFFFIVKTLDKDDFFYRRLKMIRNIRVKYININIATKNPLSMVINHPKIHFNSYL